MVSGLKFSLRLESIKLQVFTQQLSIKREHKQLPNLEFELAILAVLVSVQNTNVVLKVLLKEIKLLDYFKR